MFQTTGASNDFEQATQMARSMVTEYGMSENLVRFNTKETICLVQPVLKKSIPEQTA